MDLPELQKQFDEISEQVKEVTKSQPVIAVLINALFGLFKILFNLLNEQNKTIQALQEKLGNKVVDSKRANNENINGRGSEKKKGVDSSDKKRDKSQKDTCTAIKDVVVEHKESFIGYDGQEYSNEEATKLLGTTFTGKDGKRYKYIRKINSSLKTDYKVHLTQTQYYKLEYVAVGDDDAPLADAKPQTPTCAKTDFLKKTPISVSLMSHILYIWFRLKCPLNRISASLLEYGISLSRQQLYKNVGISAYMLMPVFKHMESHLKDEKQLCIDETYHSCREKRRFNNKTPPDDDSKSKSKKQKSPSKTMRSYFYGIVGNYVCLYYHDLDRESDIPRDILTKNKISEDAFVETDGFYKLGFNVDINMEAKTIKELFTHGVCYVHLKRYFCVLLNYATKTDGSPIAEFVNCKWEQDIIDSNRICDKISNAFHICNDITKRCNADKTLDIVTLKNKELRPIIEDIFNDARAINDAIRNEDESKRRSCSKKFRDAITYAVNKEFKLKSFLDSPYGLMSSTKVEEKFRELDILRNGMMASDTCQGAENLALFYSLYKTAQMHGIEFESYMQRCITVMSDHLNEIEFAKDSKGTITGYKSHSISEEILENLMPWNMAKA